MAVKKLEPKSRTRVFILDDATVVRRGLQLLIDQQSDLKVCGDAADALSGMAQVSALKPDLAIVDLSLKQGNGLDVIKQLHRLHPHVRILVFSMHEESFYVAHALAAGAHGYVLKEDGASDVVNAIRSVMQGKPYLSPKVAARMKACSTKLPPPMAHW